MKIVHLGKYYPPACGGIETHVQQLAHAQAALGHEVTVIAVNHLNRQRRDVNHRSLYRTLTCYEVDGDVRVIRVGRLGRLFKMDITPRLTNILRNLAVDVRTMWHLHTPNPAMLLGLNGVAAVQRFVITHHSDIIQQRWGRLAFLPLETSVYRRANWILSDSPTYIDGSATLQRFRDMTECLPLGIDLQPFIDPSDVALEYTAQLRRQYAAPLWLFVGRLVYYKALHIALSALRSVPGTLIIVGCGPLKRELQQLATRFGVSDRVYWHGPASSDQLVGAYHSAHALWFPSNARSEGFGLVQVEAMASRCPVINTDIPHSGVSWVSRHEETGLTVAVNDAQAFAAAARRLLDQPQLRDRLSNTAREQAVERFGRDLMAKRSLEIYHRTAGPTAHHVSGVRKPNFPLTLSPTATSHF